jgi:ssDNA-binding Zn-finger/Zn-ribbon topoisomerase 1
MTDDVKCPLCGSATSLRIAKKGSNVGEQFYVCEHYPECKGKVKYQTQGGDKNKSKLKKMMDSMPSDVQWLSTFECIRSQAAPVMSKISKASGGNDKELLEALNEATRHLPILLQTMREIPEPSKEEYKKSREDVLKGIEFYIQGCQSHIKWVETRKNSYLNEGLAYFNEATRKFDSATQWLVKRS